MSSRPPQNLSARLSINYAETNVQLLSVGLQMFMCIYGLIVFLETPHTHRKSRMLYIIVSFTILSLTIMSTVCNNYAIYMTLFNAVPGDPQRTREAMDMYGGQGTPEYAVARITSTFVAFVGDGLLLYRCYFFWHDRKWVVILPALVYIASVVMGFLQMLWAGVYPGWRIDFSVSWISLNAALNVLITALISSRLLFAAYRNSRLLPSFSSKVYIGVVAILVEAALPLAITGIVLATFMNQSRGAGATRPHQGVFRILYFFFLAISPQMIIFRVTTGRGLARDGYSRQQHRRADDDEAAPEGTPPMSTALHFSNTDHTQSVGFDENGESKEYEEKGARGKGNGRRRNLRSRDGTVVETHTALESSPGDAYRTSSGTQNGPSAV